MHVEDWMELVVHGFEAVGVVILAIGSVVALVKASLPLVRGGRFAYERARQGIGKAVLLGLEVLIIADIVETITIEPTAEKCPGARDHRAGSNIPQLLAGDRARGRCAVAPCRDAWATS